MYYEEKEDREGGKEVPGMRLGLRFQTVVRKSLMEKVMFGFMEEQVEE